jgi:hypothetical protein
MMRDPNKAGFQSRAGCGNIKPTVMGNVSCPDNIARRNMAIEIGTTNHSGEKVEPIYFSMFLAAFQDLI